MQSLKGGVIITSPMRGNSDFHTMWNILEMH